MKNASQYSQSKINYYLNIKQVEIIRSSSSATIFIEEGLEGNLLTVELSNLGQAILNKIKLKKLMAKLDAGAKLTMQGIAEEQAIKIWGAGEFDGTALLGKKGTVEMSGNAVVSTNVSDTLNLSVADQGSVKYCGKPALTQKVSEDAKVMPLEARFCK
jgi:hypothetical protein